MKKSSFFIRHLRSVNESYFEHMRHAFCFSKNCFKASIALLIHSVLPFIFITTGSSIITRLYGIMASRSQIANLFSKKEIKIAIIGFGASGLIAFRNLVNGHKNISQKLTIQIFDKSPIILKGIAYSTTNPHHLLNVPAFKMSIDSEDKNHFLNWLNLNGYGYQKNDFVPRQIFGIYLESVFNEAIEIANAKGISYEIVHKEIEEIEIKNNYYIIGGGAYQYCVLSIGARFKNWRNNFWNIDLNNLIKNDEVHLVGSGLTAFDAAISMKDMNYQGKIFFHSRTGILPKSHKIIHEELTNIKRPVDLEDAALELSAIFKKFVKACRESEDWRLCFDAFRPITQEFWVKLNIEKKKRFIRHCFRIWNTHRHRCPESQFAIISQMIESGRIVLSKNSFSNFASVDCSGFGFEFDTKLINGLIRQLIVKRDEIGFGVISKKPNFYIIGALNFGSLFEITAIPDIVIQSQKVSSSILKSMNSIDN